MAKENKTIEAAAELDNEAQITETTDDTINAAPLDLGEFRAASGQADEPKAAKSINDLVDNRDIKNIEHYNILLRDFNLFLGQLINMARPALPNFCAIYTADAIFAISDSAALMCEEEGWLIDGVGGQFGKKIAFGFTVGGFAMASYPALKYDVAMLKGANSNAKKTPTESVPTENVASE